MKNSPNKSNILQQFLFDKTNLQNFIFQVKCPLNPTPVPTEGLGRRKTKPDREEGKGRGGRIHFFFFSSMCLIPCSGSVEGGGDSWSHKSWLLCSIRGGGGGGGGALCHLSEAGAGIRRRRRKSGKSYRTHSNETIRLTPFRLYKNNRKN